MSETKNKKVEKAVCDPRRCARWDPAKAQGRRACGPSTRGGSTALVGWRGPTSHVSSVGVGDSVFTGKETKSWSVEGARASAASSVGRSEQRSHAVGPAAAPWASLAFTLLPALPWL